MRSFSRIFLCVVAFSTLLTLPVAANFEEGPDWPKKVEAAGASITMYQPQIDSWKGNTFEARAALSVVPKAGAEPIFGAIWISGRFQTDKERRVITFSDISIPRVRFADATEEQQQKLIAILEKELEGWRHETDLDVLLPTLELADRDPLRRAQLKNDPPRIIVKHSPAVLILIDGEPIFEDVKDTKLERVVNTPYVLLKGHREFYLASDKLWFTAKDLMGPWTKTEILPKEVAEIDRQIKEQEAEQEEENEEVEAEEDPRIPEIVISKEPAELIFIDGKTELEPVEGNDVLAVSNTDSDVIFDIQSQDFFVLLSGRWYRSKNLDHGPWEWVANDELPEAFSKIPSDSDVGYLRANISGTDESKDALLEQSIPQTATVKREVPEEKVSYDGEPKFEDIEGTPMRYAVNTPSAVILAEGAYYWCDQGVWFVSSSPKGPWKVCDSIPDVIYTIPPSNPHYNVTYVKVYDSTPDVVYVGYTPGYTGSYVSHSCVVYGTGYHYTPWYTPYHYYARPATWGFHVRWNPWYGWSFGLSYSNGPFHFGFGWGSWGGGFHGGWWGPGFYRPYPMPYGIGFRAGFRHGYWHGRWASGRPVPYPGRPRTTPNLYRRPRNSARIAASRDRMARQAPGVARDRKNNVYTDRSGNVYRRRDNGTWERRDKGQWTKTPGIPSSGDRTRPVNKPSTRPNTRPSTRPSTPSTRPSTRPSTPSTRPSTRPSTPSTRPSTRPSTPSTRPSTGLSRDYRARQRGSSRARTMGSRSSGRSYRSAPRRSGGRRR